MVKVSVIIPVYNGETHLRQCLDSVCGQTLREIEIICVDDGSTDSSLQILKEYQAKDERVQVLHQNNQYAGAARNHGKRQAAGEYLVFWDCDDFFEPDALEKMYEKAVSVQADVCVCGASQYLQEKEMLVPHLARYMNKKRIPKEESFNIKSNEEYILNFTNEAAWNKMFRREFVEKLNLDFQPVRNGNDVYFTVNALCLAERIVTVDKPFVNYRKNQSKSLVGTISKSPLTPFQAWTDAAENLQKLDVFPERSFANKAVGSFIYLLRNIRQKDAFAEAVNYLQQGALERLHIKVREEGYYYTKWYNEFVKHLIEDTPEDLHSYLAFVTYIQLTERSAEKTIQGLEIKRLKTEVKSTKEELKKLKAELKKVSAEQEKTNAEQKKTAEALKKADAEQKKTAEALKRANAEILKIRNSWSYRIGKVLVWLPGKVKRFLKRK